MLQHQTLGTVEGQRALPCAGVDDEGHGGFGSVDQGTDVHDHDARNA